MRRFEGKVALITGGSRGIGRAIVERLAREGAGVSFTHLGDAEEAAQVVVAVDAAGGRAMAIEADAASGADGARAVGETASAFGDLHILVANAGVQAPTPSESFDEVTFERILQVDLLGVARLARAFLAYAQTRPAERAVVATSSVHQVIPKPGYLAYAMAKAGLAGLVRTLALEGAPRGLRVNAVGPGAVDTDMNAAWAGDPRRRAQVEAHIPMGRAASPQEIAAVAAFLASSDASYVTGQTLYACGGLTLHADFARNWSS
jgi:glucose 1-dehydrogenase